MPELKNGELEIITSGFIVVYIDSFQLQITVSMVTASGVDTMLITDDLPKLRHKKSAFSYATTPPRIAMRSSHPVLTTRHCRSFNEWRDPGTALGLALYEIRKLKLGGFPGEQLLSAGGRNGGGGEKTSPSLGLRVTAASGGWRQTLWDSRSRKKGAGGERVRPGNCRRVF